jgi:hypothetical protein
MASRLRSPNSTRLPDFIVIGAKKSGTSMLFAWLGAQPEIVLPVVKEPDFFSRGWHNGRERYLALFSEIPPDKLTGEASNSYTDPDLADLSSARIADVVPNAQLIYLVRDPIERIRSHYRHELQRGRERRPFLDAIGDPNSAYVRYSRYYTNIRPYLDRFSRDQLCVVRFEDVVGPGSSGWRHITDRLGLAPRAAPGWPVNVTASKGRYTRPMRWMWEHKLDRLAHRAPASVRRLGKRLLIRRDPWYEERLAESERVAIPDEIVRPVWRDVDQLAPWIAGSQAAWSRSGSGDR